MEDKIKRFEDVIIQIATPYSKGTGFYLKGYNLIVTNAHVVRDNREVIIGGNNFEKTLSKVIYTDEKYDIALLEAPKDNDMPLVMLDKDSLRTIGEGVVAVGHPFGMKYSFTSGIISNTRHIQNDIPYIQHDAALNPGNSGGPLISSGGNVIGVNTFIMRDSDNIGFSLPANYLYETLEEFKKSGKGEGARCSSCLNIVYEDTVEKNYCGHCGARVMLPSHVDEYEAVGIAKTIENIIEKLGYQVGLSRIGPKNWEVQQGSAKINIRYYDKTGTIVEKTGLIIGDAYLCNLPKHDIKPLYEFLLRQNYNLDSLTFSLKENDIVLSLIIYDRYLNEDTGIKLFNRLFEKADFFDDILIDKYGATSM